MFPYLQESLGAFSFVPFAAVLFMTLIFVLIFLPETKGTTPEELRDEIARNLSAFLATSHDTTYEDHSSSAGNPIDVEWRRAMDDLRRQEELDMLRGAYSKSTTHSPITTHRVILLSFVIFLTLPISYRPPVDYGFQHIDLNHLAVESDWRTYVAGELDRIDK